MVDQRPSIYMTDVNWYWLGTNPLQQQDDQVIVPHAVVETDLIRLESDLFWGYDSMHEAVAISSRSDAFREDRYEFHDETRLTDRPVIAIPSDVMATYDAFEPGESLHFATTDALGAAGRCLVMSSDRADALLEGARAIEGSIDPGHRTR